jgi:hypothetical protein
MGSRNRGRGDPLRSTDALLNAADTFAARPAEEVMDELGLSREKAEHWQQICAELAQAVRSELSANSRPRHIVGGRNEKTSTDITANDKNSTEKNGTERNGDRANDRNSDSTGEPHSGLGTGRARR